MADRVSASITIGGTLPRSLLPDLAALVQAEGLSTEWDGEPFTLSMFRAGVPLELMAHEVAWGRFERVESWCITHSLPFARWSGVEGRRVTPFNPANGAPSAPCSPARARCSPMPPTRTIISLSAVAPSSVSAATRRSSPTSRLAISPCRRCG